LSEKFHATFNSASISSIVGKFVLSFLGNFFDTCLQCNFATIINRKPKIIPM